jgi:hypothetical protein
LIENIMPSALDKLRERARQPASAGVEMGAHRGVVSTMAAQVDLDVIDDEGDVQAIKPGRLPQPAQPVGRTFPPLPTFEEVDGGKGKEGREAAHAQPAQGDAPAAASRPPESSPSLSAIERLRERARQEQQVESEVLGFRKNMAALRTLGRLMEAVYIRPGNASPVESRMQALLTLTQASQALSQELLDVVGETSDRSYVRAMAMDAVVALVGRAWEDAEEFLRTRPVELLRQAAVNPEVIEASMAMAQKTWSPVTTQAQHEEALALAAHKAYWSLYMLGEYVVGMDASRCEMAVSRLMSYLQDYPQPRGSSPEMRASWLTASMGRLRSLIGAEIKARFAVPVDHLHNAKPVTADVINECVDLAIEGFENVERHAQKILGVGFVERAASGDIAVDGERSVSGR